MKNQNIQDPIQFFKKLSNSTKKIFIEDIQEQGLFPKPKIETRI